MSRYPATTQETIEIGGNLVSTIGRASTPRAWKPGFHRAWRRRMLPLGAGTVSGRRTGGNQVSTVSALTARWQFSGNLARCCARRGTRRAAAGEGARVLCPKASRSAMHRRNGGKLVSTIACASTPQGWKPGFQGAWSNQILPVVAGPHSARRNVGGNQVSTVMEIQNG